MITSNGCEFTHDCGCSQPRKPGDVLKDIETTKRKLKRYKAARRLLRVIGPAGVAMMTAGTFGVGTNVFLMGFLVVMVAVPLLAWLTFWEDYGQRTVTSKWGDKKEIPGTGLNVFDYLERHVSDLYDELTEAGAK